MGVREMFGENVQDFGVQTRRGKSIEMVTVG